MYFTYILVIVLNMGGEVIYTRDKKSCNTLKNNLCNTFKKTCNYTICAKLKKKAY